MHTSQVLSIMFRQKALTLLLGICLGLPAFAQENNLYLDSLLHEAEHNQHMEYRFEAYSHVVAYLSRSQPDSAIFYARKGLELAEKYDSDRAKGVFYNQLGVHHETIGDKEASMDYFEKAADFNLKAGDTLHYITARMNIATILQSSGAVREALEIFLGVINQIPFNEENANLIVAAYENSGNAFFSMNNYDKALEYLQKGLELAEGRQVPRIVGIATTLTLIHLEQDNFDEAFTALDRADQLALEYRNYINYSFNLNSRADVFRKMGQLDSARVYYGKALFLAEQLPYPYVAGAATFRIGMLDCLEANFQTGLEKMETGRAMVADEQSLEVEAIFAEELAQAYKESGNFEKAYEYQIEFQELNDSLFNLEKESDIKRLTLDFEDKQKDQQIKAMEQENQLLEQDNKLADYAIERANIWIGAIISGGVILLIILGILYNRYQIKTRSEKEKELLVREIHHRVKNNLQIISSLLNLQSMQLTDDKARQAVSEGRDRVQAMGLIHQRLYQHEHLARVNIRDYTEALVDTLRDSFSLDPEGVDLKLDIDSLELDVDIAVPMGLILNELVSNAYKHAFREIDRPFLGVSIKKQAEGLRLEVRDNGKGLPEEINVKSTRSFGFRLVKSLTKELKGVLSVNNQGGAVITVDIQRLRTMNQI